MLRSLLSLATLVLLTLPAEAQRTAPLPLSVTENVCAIGEAEAELDAGGVRARLYNTGGLFWRPGTLGAGYEVPKGDGVGAIFVHTLMVGGLADGELRFAGANYSPYEFWPGPLDANALTNGELCATFDRIWTVTTADLAAFENGADPADDLADWPVGVGAPFFVDADADGAQGSDEPTVALRPGDAGYDAARVIDLGAGERPVVFGAQTAWWVMNDRGGDHDWSEVPAIGAEVRVTAWTTADADRPDLFFSTFYRYDILNRSDTALDDAFAAVFTDADIGNFDDDYANSDADRSMAIYYNGDENDERGYGVPPALGLDLLGGAYASVPSFAASNGPTGDPGRGGGAGEDAYNFMNGFWKDGTPFKIGDDGYNTNGPPTRWIFNGEPGTFWSEEDIDGEGRANPPSERRGMISSALGRIGPGEEATFDVGILFAQGGHRLDSVRRLKAASDDAQARYDSGDLFRAVAATAPPPPPTPPASAPTLLAPADGAEATGDQITFEWTPVDGATGYRLEFADSEAFEFATLSYGPETTRTLALTDLPANRADPTAWRVVPLAIEVEGPPSETRRLTAYHYRPGALRLRDGTPAFVEVSGPGGADPCGPEAGSTDGCDEVGGNLIYASANGSGAYVGDFLRTGVEERLAQFAPQDYEVRFTAEGSYAYYAYSTGAAIRVPFEVWDVGVVVPGEPNDPSDDVRLIPGLVKSFVTGGADSGECTFGFLGPQTVEGFGASTQRIYAFYPTDSYAAWEAAIAPVVAGDPAGCPVHPATADAAAQIDVGVLPPIRGFRLVDATADGDVADLDGTVIRFYTVDPITSDETGPEAGRLALAVYPNPTAWTATVAFDLAEAGPVSVRLVDVLGREVAVLAEGDRAAGSHRAPLPTAGLAPGVYLVVLDGGGARAVRTVTVVR